MSKKKVHGNSHKSERDNHLYVFYDHRKRRIHKFGISSDPIDSEDTSGIMRDQMSLIHTVVAIGRFTMRIFMRLIPGRKKALEIEDDLVEKFVDKHGELPPGNPNHAFPSRKKGK